MALKITFEAQTDVGLERSDNQDHYGSSRQENVEFFVVCDGMGGHAGGSTASRLAVQAIEDTLEEEGGDAPSRMESAILVANDAIHSMAAERRELRGMGTTVVMLGVDREAARAYVAHVGDSRAYRLRGAEFERLTRDHTMVQRLVDEGIISEDDAESHPQSNVISRSLGGQPTVEVEHGPNVLDLQDGDIYLLCSDGLCGLVSEPEMASTLANLPPDEATGRLIEQANEAGGYDNITAEVILIGAQPPAYDPDALQLIHPPKGPEASERLARIEQADRDREERERQADYEKQRAAAFTNDGPAQSNPQSDADGPAATDTPTAAPDAPINASTGAPVLEDQSTGKLLFVLGGLILLLVFLVLGLILRTSSNEDVVVPGAEKTESETTDPVDEDLEPAMRVFDDLEPQPVYDVADEYDGYQGDDASDRAASPADAQRHAADQRRAKDGDAQDAASKSRNPFASDENADVDALGGKSPVFQAPVSRENPFAEDGDDAPAVVEEPKPASKPTVEPTPSGDDAATPSKAENPFDETDTPAEPKEEDSGRRIGEPPRARDNPF